MKRTIMLIAGITAALAGSEARAACQDGTIGGCELANGCPGERECIGTTWGGCEPVAGTKSCTVCSGPGTQQCDGSGNIVSACTRAEQCNNCDDDQDGQIDEGLQSCSGVTCGHIFELCGDGLDNDCDNSTDEGCTQCTASAASFPYVFNSQLEIRRDTVQPGGSPVYGRRMDSTWKFIPSHRVNSFALRFDQFALESGFDSFKINGTQFSGTPALPFTTGMFNVSPGQQATLGFLTDTSVQNTGVRTSQVSATCNSGGSNWFYSMGLNEGADGVLLHQDDNAYFTFTLPAGREVFISLDHNFGAAADFDMFVTFGGIGTLFGTSCSNSALCGFSGNTTGEVVHVPAQSSGDRTVKVNINAFSGSGRFRLFLASPVVSYPYDVDLAFEANVAAGSTDDQRAKGAWGQAQRIMMSATEGQYRIRSNAYVSRGVSCYSCYDVVYSDLNNLTGTSNACVPAQQTFSIGGPYIILIRPYWNLSGSWFDWEFNGASCSATATTERVGETIVHEWGHYEFGHGDERDSSQNNQCGFSLMAGSGLANFTGGNQFFEFCTDSRHGTNPASGTSAATGSSNWSDIIDEYSSMEAPSGTGDFSRMTRLGDMMSSGSFVSFTEN